MPNHAHSPNQDHLRLHSRLATLLTFWCTACGAPAPAEEGPAGSTAQALTADAGGSAFALVARHSGKCLDVENGSLANGANIRQWPCNGYTPQSFRLQSASGGYFHLVNVNSGKVADVASASMSNGANVLQWTNTGGTNQQFQLVPTSNGWFKVVARHSGKVLNVAGCSTADGANVEQQTWASQQCQEWRLQPVGAVKIVNKNNGRVLDVASASSADGANVATYTYANQNQQHFTWTHHSDGYYRVTPVHSGKAVEVAGCASGDGGNVAQWSWLDNPCQQWRITPSADGYLQIGNRNSGKALDVAYCGSQNGANVQQWSWLDNDCQKFRLESSGFSASSADVGAHDPHVIKQGSYYYLTTTGGTIGIRRSTDRLSWTTVGNVFSAVPAWVNTELGTTITDLWAPDIAYFGGKYWLYYSGSVFGTNTSVIGVASSATLDPSSGSYGWTDHGLVIKTTSSSSYNAIDPNVTLDANGVPWLALGSFWSGIKLRRIDPNTGKLSSADSTTYSLASRGGGAIEAPSILRANGYYYLFVSYDSCCSGADSTYRTMVGRSSAITGPYVDRSGAAMTSGNATQLLASVDHWRGPGGGAAFFDGSAPYFAHHYYDSTDGGAAKLQIRPISFADGWPVMGAPIP